MWVGDVDSIRELIEISKKLQKYAIDEVTKTHNNSRKSREKEFRAVRDSRYDEEFINQLWLERDESELQSEVDKVYLELRTKEKAFKRMRVGDPDDIISEIKPSDVQELELSLAKNHSYDSNVYSFELVMDQEDGCQLKCSGPTDDWVILVNNYFEPILKSSNPWYSIFRKFRFTVPLVGIPIVLAIALILKAINDHHTDLKSSDWATLWFLSLAFSPIFTFPTAEGIRKIIPAFELSASGKNANVANKVTRVGGIFLWLLSTIIIPILLTR